jgi:N-methylhydantoinase A
MPADPGALEEVYRDLSAEVRERIGREARDGIAVEVAWEADLRFARQTWEVTVPVPEGPVNAQTVDGLGAAFLEKYQRLYGRGTVLRESGIQLVNCRAIGIGRRPKEEMRRRPVGPPDPSGARRGERPVRVPVAGRDRLELRPTAIFDGRRLAPGMRMAGPVLIEYPDTTVFVPDGAAAEVDDLESCVIECSRT